MRWTLLEEPLLTLLEVQTCVVALKAQKSTKKQTSLRTEPGVCDLTEKGRHLFGTRVLKDIQAHLDNDIERNREKRHEIAVYIY